MARTKAEKATVNFESALAELNELVEKMEQGNLSLEDALQGFERGVVLTRTCQEALKAADQKVQILIQNNGKSALTTFEDDNNA